jgi:hypothetical protein
MGHHAWPRRSCLHHPHHDGPLVKAKNNLPPHPRTALTGATL